MSNVARLHQPAEPSPLAEDYLEGISEIAAFLGGRWTPSKIYHAREKGALPIRRKVGIGLYAFKSELVDALKAPETLGGGS